MFVKSAAVLALATLSAAQYNAPGAPSSTSSASSSAPTVAAPSNPNTIDVQVGNGGLVFSPSTVTAPQGATINFHFYPIQHSIAESDFNSPCSFKQGGIWSGFFPTSSGVASQMFSVKLNDTNPHWIYCSQTALSHCQAGMAMVINPPANSNNTISAYMSAAKNAPASTSGTTVEGGIVEANTVPSTTTSSAPASTTSGAATDGKSMNWAIMGASLALSGVWSALMA